MMHRILQQQEEAWRRKPSLRALYRQWAEEARSHFIPGPTLEIGCGIGNLKETIKNVLSLDVIETKWTDIVGDAAQLPLKEGSLSNLILFDTLHHLPRPLAFLGEALRVLRPGGRVAIIDPYISPLSYPFYRFLHHEPVILRCDPLAGDQVCTEDPEDSNQALATLLFFSRRRDPNALCPGLRLVTRKRFAFFAYPLTGGFSKRTFLPHKVILAIQRGEKLLAPLSFLLAFRTLVVLEKRSAA